MLKLICKSIMRNTIIKEFLKSSNKDDIIDMTSSNQTVVKGDEDD